MNFYRRRPFALIITISMSVYAGAAFMSDNLRIIIGTLLIPLSLIGTIFIRRRKDFRICGIPSTLFFALLCVALLISFLMTHAYYGSHEAHYRDLADTNGTNKISAEIVSVESDTSFSSVYKVKLTEIDGKPASAMGLVSTDKALGMRPGSAISFNGEFCHLEDFYEYRDVSRIQLLADGAVFACRMDGNAELVGSTGGVYSFFDGLRRSISSEFSVYLDRDSAALSNAILLGERNELRRIYRDFTYTGTLHIIALSGMHIAIVGGFLEKLMHRLKIGAPVRRISLCILMILYAAVTGFSVSVVRAVLMLLIANLMYFFKNGIDRITSLFIACGVIVTANPPAIYDVGLQLSFFATLGVLLFTDVPIYEKFRGAFDNHPTLARLIYRRNQIFSSVTASLGATVFVIPLQWIYFGEMSLLSVPATTVLSPVLNLLLFLLIPFLPLCVLGVNFLCKPFAFAVKAICHLAMKAAEILADISPLISLRYPFVPIILIAFIAAVIIMMIKNVRGWGKSLIAYTVAVSLILIGAAIYGGMRSGTPSVSYAAVKNSDIFAVFADGKAVIIDCTDGSTSAMYEAMDILAGNCFTSVDTLIFTRLNSRHINAAKTLMSRRKIDRILIPDSEIDRVGYLASDLARIAEEYGVSLIIYDRDKEAEFTLGSITVSMPEAVKLPRSDRTLPALKFTVDNASLSYIGRSAWEDEYIRSYLSGCDNWIFGMNGPVFKGYDGSIDLDDAKFIFTADNSLAAILSENASVTVGERVDIIFK